MIYKSDSYSINCAGYMTDCAFKGAQPATRYEVASVVARALAYADTQHASKQDLEMLKKLVMEFKDELDALGVKVDKLDKRVAVLEDRLGGWKLRGILRFDAKFSNGDQNESTQWASDGSKNEFTKEQFRLFLTKQIDENTYFETQYRAGAWAGAPGTSGKDSTGAAITKGKVANGHGRGEQYNMSWRKVFVQTKLPYDITFRVGRFQFDWEGDNGLYTDEDAAFGDWRVDGFSFKKTWNTFSGEAVIGRNNSGETRNSDTNRLISEQQMLYAVKLDWRPNEKFFLGGMGYWQKADGEGAKGDSSLKTYAVDAGFKFTPAVELKGIYYWQKYDDVAFDDSQKSWKAILDIKQDLLKFTSLWVEYSQETNNFGGNNWANGGVARYSLGTYNEPGVLQGRPVNDNTSKYWFVKAEQKWNKKWGSFLRYTHADFDTLGRDNATEWGVGITYQYTPAIAFMLAYDGIDYGDGNTGKNANGDTAFNGKDNVILFRTTVKF